MAAIGAINSTSSPGDAQQALIEAQQKLTTDLAAKAAAKVIIVDKATVLKVQKAVAEAQPEGGNGSTRNVVTGGRLDVTA